MPAFANAFVCCVGDVTGAELKPPQTFCCGGGAAVAPPNWPNADGAGAVAGAGVEKRDRMSCLTSFFVAGVAVGGVGLWKSSVKRSLLAAGVAATGAMEGACGCCGGGATAAACERCATVVESNWCGCG